MNESKTVSVRRQKVKKGCSRLRLYTLIFLVLLLLLTAGFAEQLCPFDPNAQIFTPLAPPGDGHLCGTDRFGRDLFSRILVGLRTSLFSALALVAVITLTGTALGVVCGFQGGFADSAVMRFSDICLAFPGLVFALAIAALLNGGLQNAVLSLAVISWPKYARIARSQTLAVKHRDYIKAARLAGDTGLQIVVRHILPNILGPVLVTATLDIGTMMMELAGLSFLGLGAQPPTPELGNMMSGGRSMLQIYPWVILSPGIAILIAVMLFNLLGDGLRDYLDPKSALKSRRDF